MRGPGEGARGEPVLTTGLHSLALAQTLRSPPRTKHFAGGPQGRPGKMWSESTFASEWSPGPPLWPPGSASGALTRHAIPAVLRNVRHRYRLFVVVYAVALVGLGAGAIIIPALAPRAAAAPSVYPLAQVLTGLQRQPRAWVGRTVYVRGWIVGTGAYNVCANGRVASSCPLSTWIYLNLRETHHSYSFDGGPPVASVSPDGAPELRLLSATPNVWVWNKWLLRVRVTRLPDGLYTLPVVGSLVARAFPPRDTDERVARIRLSSPSACPGSAPTICPDGVLLKP